MQILIRALLGSALFSVCLSAQQGPLSAIDDRRVAQLLQNGVRQDEIIRLISTAPQVNFDLTPAAMDGLMKAGVSEDVIKTMAARENGPVSAGHQFAASNNGGNNGKPRVFVSTSPNAWSYDFSGSNGRGGSHPQTVEVMKTFGQSCPSVVVTNDPRHAQYTVAFDRESTKILRKDNKMVVFDASGNAVYSSSTRALGNAVRGFCSSLK